MVLFLPTTGSFGHFARILLNYSRKMAAAAVTCVLSRVMCKNHCIIMAIKTAN